MRARVPFFSLQLTFLVVVPGTGSSGGLVLLADPKSTHASLSCWASLLFFSIPNTQHIWHFLQLLWSLEAPHYPKQSPPHLTPANEVCSQKRHRRERTRLRTENEAGQGEEERSREEDAAIFKQNILFSLESTCGIGWEANACENGFLLIGKYLWMGIYFWLELKTKLCLGEISHDWHWALFSLCTPLSPTEGAASLFYLLDRAIPSLLTFARFQIQVLAASSQQWEKGGRFQGSWSPVLSSFCRSTHCDSLAYKTSPPSLTTGNTG